MAVPLGATVSGPLTVRLKLVVAGEASAAPALSTAVAVTVNEPDAPGLKL